MLVRVCLTMGLGLKRGRTENNCRKDLQTCLLVAFLPQTYPHPDPYSCIIQQASGIFEYRNRHPFTPPPITCIVCRPSSRMSQVQHTSPGFSSNTSHRVLSALEAAYNLGSNPCILHRKVDASGSRNFGHTRITANFRHSPHRGIAIGQIQSHPRREKPTLRSSGDSLGFSLFALKPPKMKGMAIRGSRRIATAAIMRMPLQISMSPALRAAAITPCV